MTENFLGLPTGNVTYARDLKVIADRQRRGLVLALDFNIPVIVTESWGTVWANIPASVETEPGTPDLSPEGRAQIRLRLIERAQNVVQRVRAANPDTTGRYYA